MSSVLPAVVLATLLLLVLASAGEGLIGAAVEGRLRELGGARRPETRSASHTGSGRGWLTHRPMSRPLGAFLAVPAALLGTRIAGPVGFVVGAAATAALPTLVARRSSRNRREALERQLADLVESSSLAVRTGLSMVQALEFATQEADEPMAGLARRMAEEQQVGVPFEIALQHLGESLDTEDARLFTLVVGIHARSGGNLAGALDEVGSTVRHRIAVRRELRAFSAQGRVSGAILGSLPIAFFLVLAAASRRELGPVYRSAPGIAMVVAGFVMEGLAFLWIRRLLRVEI